MPGNANYEGSERLLFDEHDHPVSREAYQEMNAQEKARCRWRRCYKMVTLLHTNRKLDFFLFVAVRVISAKTHECPILYELAGQLVETVGKGVMKRLIVDRGFLDGEAISTCKREHGIDVLIPVRRNMDIYKDAEALFQLPEADWVGWQPRLPQTEELARARPSAILRRERKRQEKLEKLKEEKPPAPPEKTLVKTEVAAIGHFRSWSACTVPLTVVANREHYADGHVQTWFLLDTREVRDPRQARLEYRLRTAIEERHRQLKCFSDLTDFTSRAFSLVVNQVVFIVLAYSLLQLYLPRQGRRDLTGKTPLRIRQQLLPAAGHIIIYWRDYYGLFNTYELIEILTTVSEEARKKLAEKSRRRRLDLGQALNNPRPP